MAQTALIDPQKPAVKTRRRKWSLRVLWTVGVVILSGCLYWLWCVHAALAERDALIAELRAKGEPVWWDEVVEKALAEQPADSGADLFRQAIAVLQGGNPSRRVLPSQNFGAARRDYFPKPKVVPEAQEELRLAAPAFALAEQAARRRPGVVTPNLRDAGAVTNWRQLAAPASLSLMLDLEAFDALALGDPRRAYRAALLSFRSADQLAAEPLMYSQQVRHGNQLAASRTLLDCLAYFTPADDEFVALDAVLAANAVRFHGNDPFVSERAYVLRVLDHEEEIGPLLRGATSSFLRRPWLERTMTDAWVRILASPLGTPTRLKTQSEVIRLVEKVRPLVDRPNVDPQTVDEIYKEFALRSPLHQSIDEPLRLLSWWGQSHNRRLRLAHQQAVFTRLALRLRRYHDKHGRFPDHLDDLCDATMPRIQLEWFGNQPIVYKPSAQGFRLELPEVIVPLWERYHLGKTPIPTEYGLEFELKSLSPSR